MISSLGRIKSFHKQNKGCILSKKNRQGDYLRVILCGVGKNRTTALIHRLVAAAFIGEIPNGYQVHHRDGNKQNNTMANLEIISPLKHRRETEKKNPQIVTGIVNYNKYTKTKKILQFTLGGEYVGEYNNAKIAEEKTGVCSRNILQVASKTPFNARGNIRKQAGGYIWQFASESGGVVS